MEDKGNNKSVVTTYNMVMYAIIAVSLMVAFYFSFIAGNTSTGKTYGSTASRGSYVHNMSLAETAGIPVSATIQKNGEFYVITTRVKNNSDYSLNEKLKIYIEDNTGSKKFVDMVYVELEAGETGLVKSKISTSNAGPPPHTITTEWQ